MKQYQKLLSLDGVELTFEKEAIEAVADKAIELKTGARGLRSIMEDTMSDIMFNAPSDESIKKVTVTEEMVNPCKSGEVKTIAKPVKKIQIKKDA